MSDDNEEYYSLRETLSCLLEVHLLPNYRTTLRLMEEEY
jgi:hypothetical protein